MGGLSVNKNNKKVPPECLLPDVFVYIAMIF